jgi:hypothetical protein
MYWNSARPLSAVVLPSSPPRRPLASMPNRIRRRSLLRARAGVAGAPAGARGSRRPRTHALHAPRPSAARPGVCACAAAPRALRCEAPRARTAAPAFQATGDSVRLRRDLFPAWWAAGRLLCGALCVESLAPGLHARGGARGPRPFCLCGRPVVLPLADVLRALAFAAVLESVLSRRKQGVRAGIARRISADFQKPAMGVNGVKPHACPFEL